MPLMDEFKDERAKMKDAPFKEKCKYFWDYYKLHTIATICIIVFLVVLIRDVTRDQETLLYVAILNSIQITQEDADNFLNDYISFAELETDKDHYVTFDSSMYLTEGMGATEAQMASSQRMMVYTTTGQLDIIMGGSDVFDDYANAEMFYDIREILTEEQIEKYSPYFYYVDQKVVEILNSDAAAFNEEGYVAPVIPDPSKPETMEEPIPVGLFVTDCEKLNNSYDFAGRDYTAFGVMLNSTHLDNVLKFIDYIYE